MTSTDPRSPVRVVLLGASNVALGWRTALRALAQRLRGPFELFAAFGAGRSYGLTSSVLGRSLPGIESCGLWEALSRTRATQSLALLTDVGNDLGYEVPPETVAAWVESCLERLQVENAALTVTLLPIEALTRLPPRRFRLLRSLYFPGSRLAYGEALARAGELQARLERLAAAAGAGVILPAPHWYGFDGIHIRGCRRREAWDAFFDAWPGNPATPERRDPSCRVPPLLFLAPERRRLWGLPWQRAQPCATLGDGSRLFLY